MDGDDTRDDPRQQRIEALRRQRGITRAAAADLVDRGEAARVEGSGVRVQGLENQAAERDDISPEILRLPAAEAAVDEPGDEPPRAA